jgi:hypothetical protein
MLLLDRDALLAAQNRALERFGVRLELRGAHARRRRRQLFAHTLAARAGERGRCVVASRVFEAGEHVFLSRPAALALLPEQAGRRCDACLARPPTSAPLARCSRCKRQRYCSQARARHARSVLRGSLTRAPLCLVLPRAAGMSARCVEGAPRG